MGTTIDLTVEGITIDWSKNSIGIDHGGLFSAADRKSLKTTQRPYRFFHELDRYGPSEAAFVRSLSDVLPRLDLMGHSLAAAEREYNQIVAQTSELLAMISDQPSATFFNFEEYCNFVLRYPLSELDRTHVDFDNPQKTQ